MRNPTPRLWHLAALNVMSQTGDRANLPGPVCTSRQSHRMYNTSTNGREAIFSTLCSSVSLPHCTPSAGPFSSHV
jgi:hypothetical protein